MFVRILWLIHPRTSDHWMPCSPPPYHRFFAPASKSYVERLTLICGIEFYCFNVHLVSQAQSLLHQHPCKSAAAVPNPGKYHADPGQTLSIRQESCCRGKFTVNFNGQTAFRSQIDQSAPIRDGLVPSRLGGQLQSRRNIARRKLAHHPAEVGHVSMLPEQIPIIMAFCRIRPVHPNWGITALRNASCTLPNRSAD